MTDKPNATRRSFLQGGALLAAPLAASSVSVVMAALPSPARLRHLEDESAIRALHQDWLRQVNSGVQGPLLPAAVRRIALDHTGKPESLEIDAEGSRATGVSDCTVEFEAQLPADSTLGHMAHLQGHGAVRHTERRMMTVCYLRRPAGWQIADVTLAST